VRQKYANFDVEEGHDIIPLSLPNQHFNDLYFTRSRSIAKFPFGAIDQAQKKGAF
jgi:hypothetical protein